MRLHRLELENFKGFSKPPPIEFPEMFNLLVGANGSGKTNILDAAAVALGVWLAEPPDRTLFSSKRTILETEIRLIPESVGDRVQFREAYPVAVKAFGDIGEAKKVAWTSMIRAAGKKVSRPDSQKAHQTIQTIFEQNGNGTRTICPVVAYYGAGRAWLPSNTKKGDSGKEKASHDIARRWNAFYDAFSERIRFSDLIAWFRSETLAAGTRGGKMRPGFEVVKHAIVHCVPDARDAWYDDDQKDVVLAIGEQTQPMKNLSAGQRMMLAMIGDLAIRCVTQNAQLLPFDVLGPEERPIPRVLKETPGVVLIDELDVHLHPAWQRRVASDLKRTFPGLQFICTSHSPQVIGEVLPTEVQFLHREGSEKMMEHPGQSFGMDSNWILDVLMGPDNASDKNKEVDHKLNSIVKLLADRKTDDATAVLDELRATVGKSEAIQRASSSIERFKLLGK
ncbi:MAG: AAA family ATPase [Prosthecobacter sp.]